MNGNYMDVIGTELVLARHGEAECNVRGVAGGDLGCTGLTGRGHDQAARLADRLADAQAAGHGPDLLYAAPRRRVRETAAYTADRLGLAVRIEPRLSGPHHGDVDGQPWSDIRRQFGGAAPADRPDVPFAPGAETWHQFLSRATAALAELLDRHAGQRILVLAHAETVEAAHTLLLGLPAGSSTRIGFDVDHTALTRWVQRSSPVGAVLWHLHSHNDTRHLPLSAPAEKPPVRPPAETRS